MTSIVENMTPRALREWWERFDRTWDHEPCEYGHFGCSTHEGGPCSNEAESVLFVDEED